MAAVCSRLQGGMSVQFGAVPSYFVSLQGTEREMMRFWLYCEHTGKRLTGRGEI